MNLQHIQQIARTHSTTSDSLIDVTCIDYFLHQYTQLTISSVGITEISILRQQTYFLYTPKKTGISTS